MRAAQTDCKFIIDSNERLNYFVDVPEPLHATKLAILKATERLVAAHGFEATSLRAITAAANVNLAAVNYHFGSNILGWARMASVGLGFWGSGAEAIRWYPRLEGIESDHQKKCKKV